MNTNFWDFLCTTVETAGKLAIIFLIGATISAVAEAIRIKEVETEE